MRIGILEDDPSQLELLGHWIALAGHDPQRFEHANELLSAMQDQAFDLLILDWNLPELTGIDVLRQLRQRSRVPVIFCTARDREDDVVKALQEGAQDYLRKPIRRMELLARINTVTRRAESAEGIPADSDFGSGGRFLDPDGHARWSADR